MVADMAIAISYGMHMEIDKIQWFPLEEDPNSQAPMATHLVKAVFELTIYS